MNIHTGHACRMYKKCKICGEVKYVSHFKQAVVNVEVQIVESLIAGTAKTVSVKGFLSVV